MKRSNAKESKLNYEDYINVRVTLMEREDSIIKKCASGLQQPLTPLIKLILLHGLDKQLKEISDSHRVVFSCISTGIDDLDSQHLCPYTIRLTLSQNARLESFAAAIGLNNKTSACRILISQQLNEMSAPGQMSYQIMEELKQEMEQGIYQVS